MYKSLEYFHGWHSIISLLSQWNSAVNFPLHITVFLFWKGKLTKWFSGRRQGEGCRWTKKTHNTGFVQFLVYVLGFAINLSPKINFLKVLMLSLMPNVYNNICSAAMLRYNIILMYIFIPVLFNTPKPIRAGRSNLITQCKFLVHFIYVIDTPTQHIATCCIYRWNFLYKNLANTKFCSIYTLTKEKQYIANYSLWYFSYFCLCLSVWFRIEIRHECSVCRLVQSEGSVRGSAGEA